MIHFQRPLPGPGRAVRRRAGGPLAGAVLTAAVWASGCRTVPTPTVEPQPVRLEISLSAKREFRPGDAVVLEVTLRNLTDGSFTAPGLSALTGALRFWSGREGGDTPYYRSPVQPREVDPPGAPQALGPRKTISREFLFTRLTEEPGVFYLQASHAGLEAGPGGEATGPVISRPVFFPVRGDRSVRRDAEGLILAEEAIRIAQAAAGAGSKAVDRRLIRNEFSTVDWWVLLETADPASKAVSRRGFLVNPYNARLHGETKPDFVPPSTEEPVIRKE